MVGWHDVEIRYFAVVAATIVAPRREGIIWNVVASPTSRDEKEAQICWEVLP